MLDARVDVVIASTRGARDTLKVEPAVLTTPNVLVLDASQRVLAGSSAPGLAGELKRQAREAASRRGAVVQTIATSDGAEFRVLARFFSTASGTGVTLAAEPLAPYEAGEADALLVSIAAGVLIIIVSVALTVVAARRALAPVGEMAAVAAGWSEHDLGQRFDLGEPTDEIRALGATLDGLLDKVADALTAERRLTSELAHELRTPLTALQVTAELAAGRPGLDADLREDLDDIQEACRVMASTISVLLDLARQQVVLSNETSDVVAVLEALIERSGRAGQVHLGVTGCIPVRAPAELVGRAVAPVLDNALRHSDRVEVAVEHGGHVVVTVTDFGSGVSSEVASTLFDPGRSDVGSSGLGLPLARRVARSLGGDVMWAGPGRTDGTTHEGSGARFVIALPSI